MTGAELAIAGKYVAPWAGKASLALRNRMTYRRRVDRRVHASCHFTYPRQAFRKWLKTISEADLAAPFEAAGPQLALRLDAALATDGEWAERLDRSSLALRLVEATYLAVLRIADPAVHRELSERWSRHRNEDLAAGLVEALRELGRWTVADEDLAIWLRRRSLERSRLRVAAFDVDATALAASVAAGLQDLPVVEPGTVRVLVGPFGAGKSELAEGWHRRAIDGFGAGGPVPIWLHARDAIASGGFDPAVSRFIGVGRLSARGAAVVVDGLDEVDAQAAESIARAARVWLAGSPRSSVLLTARSGVLPESDADVAVNGLDEASARALIDQLSGRSHATLGWTTELVETVKRPFFALAAAALLADGAQPPRGQAELVRNLVERALRTGAGPTTLGSGELYATLITLAVSLTNSNGTADGLSFRDRELAVSTRLVTRAQDGSVAFALPIFEQWFAAQALLTDQAPLSDALASPHAFDRWRWVLAIAVLSGSTDQVDDILDTCIRVNVGAGAWLVRQVAQGRHRSPEDSAAEPNLDGTDAGERLLRVARSWIDAAGALAPGVFPVSGPMEPIRLGVRIDGSRLGWAWSAEPGAVDNVVVLPPEVHPFAPSNGWLGRYLGAPPRGRAWPWEIIRDDLARQVLPLLEGRTVLGPDGGVWQRESRYRTARIVANVRSVLHPPLDRIGLLGSLMMLMERGGSDLDRSRFVLNGKTLMGSQVSDLHDWLAGQTFTHFERPVPAPDLGLTAGRRMVWDGYSDDQLLRFVTEVYEQACLAYEEMADTWFSSFGWSLGANTCRPFGVLGTLDVPTGEQSWTGPGLTYIQLPLEILQDEVGDQPHLLVSQSGRSAIRRDDADKASTWTSARQSWERTRAWMDAHNVDSPFRNLHGGSTVIHWAHDRPASLVAANWIWSDLKPLGLTVGTFPQLN